MPHIKQLLLLSVLIILSFVMLVVIYAFSPIQNTTIAHYEVQMGMSMKTIAYDLQRHNILQHPRRLIFLAKLLHRDKKIQAGEYQFAAGITPFKLLKKITEGDVIYYKITFVEGTTFSQWLRLLNTYPQLNHDTLTMSKNAVLDRLGIIEKSAEGLLYPATYYFRKGNSDLDVLMKAKQRMDKLIQHEWENRTADLPYPTAYQALIAASLIEKETADNEERPIIAGILVNRLQKNMLLQFDPSVIYGLAEQYQAPLTRENLKMDSVYNTYLHKGLPPTPIAMPSIQSIRAALHPTKTDYLYFVAEGNGKHVFSTSLDQHTIAVEAWRKSQSE